MYSDKSKTSSVRRANDDFLRRMLGGGGTMADGYQGSSCPICARPSARREEAPTEPPKCNAGDHFHPNTCPTEIPAPSLASVYSPRQCFRGIYSPAEALSAGTLFSELRLPFYGGKCEGKEDCNLGCGTPRRRSNCTHGGSL